MNDMNWMTEESTAAIAKEPSFLKKIEALLESFPKRESLGLLSSSDDFHLHFNKLERVREAFQVIHQELTDCSDDSDNVSSEDSTTDKNSTAKILKKLYEPIITVMDCN